MAKTQVALEITEAGVRAVETTIGRAPVILAAGEVALPPGAAKDSEILDRDAVAVALQRLWADARISSREVVLGVGNRRILVREHSTQLSNPDHIRQALPFEVQDRLPVPVDQAVLDFVPTRQDAEGVHGLLVAAVAEHMEELVGALAHAKLRATSIDLLAFGYARALAALGAPGETGLFLGIGEHTTHIVVATDGVPRFVRVVPLDIVPAGDPDADTPHGPPTPDAEPALRRTRRAAAVGPRALDPDVQAALIELVGRLRGTVNFYRDRPDAVPIDRAWIAGLHADHERLVDAVARVTETPVAPVVATDLIATSRTFALAPELATRMAGTASLLLGGIR
ncbi:type IV pilus biogenesis protein PilM [Microbacterium oleivorans]|uniref:type IV pilus biogenesis protein PilM n=1 Tax=Microbacterium oleivorans TaxID=273677 RepID=UPI002041FB19|nr:pilus assembly protein PilM [Microbacterium oleivorans]MCM3697671.1 pilus assembly protein PilM [Microbacterium oleivorans]